MTRARVRALGAQSPKSRERTTQDGRARVMSGDREAVHFAWYGPNTPEKAFGYRVIGDGFVIEMGSVDPAAQHLHTIYHDLASVLGRTAEPLAHLRR